MSAPTHTWGLAGNYLVESTATDSRLVSVLTVFHVTVRTLPRLLKSLRECQAAFPPAAG